MLSKLQSWLLDTVLAVHSYITLHYIAVFIVAYSKKNFKEPLWRSDNVWVRVPKHNYNKAYYTIHKHC